MDVVSGAYGVTARSAEGSSWSVTGAAADSPEPEIRGAAGSLGAATAGPVLPDRGDVSAFAHSL